MAKGLDKIYIRDLSIHCIIGIFPKERVTPQEVVLNIVLEADLRDACTSDEIGDTVNYKDLKNQILEKVQASSYLLIERLAESIAEICLQSERVQRVTVSVDKPGALRFARSVAVEITRSRVQEA